MPLAEWADGAPRYVISIAAARARMHPQTLRQHDRVGLVVPSRVRGKARRYSERDIEALREVNRLSSEEGVNLAGIRRILALESRVRELSAEVEYLRARLDADPRLFAVGPEGMTVRVDRPPRGRRGVGVAPADGGPVAHVDGDGEPQSGSEAQGEAGRALIIWTSL
jgi:MerR family transcriptional regulator/heat shock protein HspR